MALPDIAMDGSGRPPAKNRNSMEIRFYFYFAPFASFAVKMVAKSLSFASAIREGLCFVRKIQLHPLSPAPAQLLLYDCPAPP